MLGALGTAVATIAPVAMLAGCGQTGGTGVSGAGWVAHGAYSLRLSVPRSWAVRYFASCPVPDAPGTLIVGSPRGFSNCPDFGLGTNLVFFSSEPRHPLDVATTPMLVHGIRVLSYGGHGVNWYVPSHSAGIWGTGPLATRVAGTLARGTHGAVAAPGLISGSVTSGGVAPVPVTGPVALTEVGVREGRRRTRPTVVQALVGQFGALLPPGTYRIAASAGDASCPPVEASVTGGTIGTAPPISCNGD